MFRLLGRADGGQPALRGILPGAETEGGSPMDDSTTLAAYRQGLYATFTRAADALFEVGDALLTAAQPRSFVELSQAPSCQRRWPSLYAALADGRVDRAALRRLFARHLPPPAPGARLVLGLDTSPIHRP